MNESASPVVVAEQPLLILRGIHKHFPGVHALRGVHLEVCRGEVHALVGENGAGKSTLMHILAGVYRPDAGTIHFDGRPNITIENERAAQRLGIAIVFQERSLFDELSVAENIFAARQPTTRAGHIRAKQLNAAAAQLLERVGLTVSPQARLGDLSPAQQQMVEIAKALSLDAKLILFDEPTAALSDAETRALFRVIDRLKAQRVAILYISHRLEEIFLIGDRVTVLKDGAGQGTFLVKQTSTDELIARMVGRELALHQRQAAGSARHQRARLEVEHLTDAPELKHSRPFLENISLCAHAGEILVLAGLAGAGRTELALSLFGARRRATGTIRIDGETVEVRSPKEAIQAGLGYASEDRKDSGLFLDMDVAENVIAARLDEFGSWWFDDRRSRETAERFREQLRIATPSVHQIVRHLSGGNQQKVALSKWLLVRPKVLIVDEPTRGIDVGAKSEIHRLLRALAQEGAAVIVISSDLPEVLAIADRVIVLREGRIAGELDGTAATEAAVMRLASIGSAARAG